MPPVSGKSKGKGREVRSRNTTPISTTSTEQATVASSSPASMSYDDLLEKYGGVNSPPSSVVLRKILESLRTFSEVAKIRSDNCDKSMRELSKATNEMRAIIREQELAAEQEAEEERKERLKKIKAKKERDDDRPLAVGAHALARQDGGGPEVATVPHEPASSPTQRSQDQIAKNSRTSPSPSTSVSSHQPKPEPAIPQYQTFGEDPSAFDDPTIYHIRDINAPLTEEEKMEILGVSQYPHDDLHDLTVGPLPDRDLVNAKPANQVTANQFLTYLEPYVRRIEEEDLGFLKERGDRVGPFVIPRRGPRHYKDIWAEEDQSQFGDSVQTTTEQLSVNEPSGSIEQMTDETAETSEISTGPMLARLLAAMRPERRAPVGDSSALGNANGEGLANADSDTRPDAHNDDQQNRPLPPATYLPESIQFGSKASGPKMDYKEMDERLKQELRYIGFISEDAEPDYDGHHDDEIAARLRYLQEELQRVGVLNGARKSRVLELAEEFTAQQEWGQIAEDLDSQLNQAYLKRHRNIGKGKAKLKRPGGPGGGSHAIAGGSGVSKPSIGESIRALMQRRLDWHDIVGPVVEYGQMSQPTETIFDEENMKRLTAVEREGWSEAQEQS